MESIRAFPLSAGGGQKRVESRKRSALILAQARRSIWASDCL